MTLTQAEQAILRGLSACVGQCLPMNFFAPQTQRVIKRMRAKGLLSKRNRKWVLMTELGKKHR